ncbi:MAG: RNA polymerase sigma-70 factor (ECF subfamily) [Saprospiraceae bacterium]|jgi:RNA polymerase sigma-70 factor (ECF subfamily)
MLRIFRKKPDDCSDSELVSLYKKSEGLEYLGTLYERYTALVYGVCLKILKNEETAQDAYMTAFEKLIEKVKTQEIKEFRPWLHVLVKNHCFEILRKKGKHLTVSFETGFMQSEEIVHPFSEDLSLERENALEYCLEQLNEVQQQCVRLFYYEGKSYKEIADIKIEEVGRVRSYIQNGRRNLKHCIEQRSEVRGER